MYRVFLLAVLFAGLVPAVIFMFTHRPTSWKTLVTWDANGWVIVITLLYVWSAFRIVISRPTPPLPDLTFERIISIAFGVCIDAVVWLRLVNWLRFARNVRQLQQATREDDPPVEGTAGRDPAGSS